MNNLFLDLKSTDTFDTALERLEEYGVGSVMFTVKGNDKADPVSLPDAGLRSGGSARQDG